MRVALAMSAAREISQWSAFAASLAEDARTGRVATGWIELVAPKRRLIDALIRQGELFGRSDCRFRLRAWPTVDCPKVLARSGLTAVRVLSSVLEDEAEFVSVIRFAPR